MKRKKLFGWIGLVVLFAVMLLAAIGLLLASSPPAAYQPFQLTQQAQSQTADAFMERCIAFADGIRQPNKPYSFTIEEDEMNQYLASLDQIAFLTYSSEDVSRRPSELVEAMDRVGIVDPVVDMQDGLLSILVRTKNGNKIVSIDVSFEFADDEQMFIRLDGVRIGKLPISRTFVEGSLERLQESVGHVEGQMEASSIQNMDMVLGEVIRSIGGGAVSTRLPFSESRPKRIRDIEITDRALTIHFVPAERIDD